MKDANCLPRYMSLYNQFCGKCVDDFSLQIIFCNVINYAWHISNEAMICMKITTCSNGEMNCNFTHFTSNWTI